MIKTPHKAFKNACYWFSGDAGWYLEDHTGTVYKENSRYWLKTPTGYTEVTEDDFVEN